ncbi:MAG: protein-export chaperone SecB [Rhodospirillales bacterium]|nr:protein-export chaperone SecB [Rhodospirillales bacterium]
MTEPQTDGLRTANGNGKQDATTQAEPRPPLVINAQYVKDLSFEVPAAPAIFAQMQQRPPEIAIKVDVQAKPLDVDAHIFEVMLEIRADCKSAEQVAFILELSYGGVFTINVQPQDVRPVLLIECPRMLFPFARQILASTTMSGGFLPLMLGPVDFAALYVKQQQEGQNPEILPTMTA